MSLEPLNFAKCPSLYLHFLVEHAAKHKKYMKKQNMMRNDKEWKSNDGIWKHDT